jgi:putative transposase
MIAETVEELTPLIGTRPACRALGASAATVYRRRRPPTLGPVPQPRPRPVPERALSEPERAEVLSVLTSERFVDVSPEECWATLLDEGIYLCSVRTMYRILGAQTGDQKVRDRRDQLTHPPYAAPELLAEAPNETWSWDISKLKGPVRGQWFHLYVILDMFSRYIVGWTVHEHENAQVAVALIEQATTQQNITPKVLTLHADRGAPMRSKLLAELLQDLGVSRTHSRPYTSSDNPYSEAGFKTLKYRPTFPARFDSIDHARAHCREFVDWYQHQHRHSGIGLMTPHAVHHGHGPRLYAARTAVLNQAYARTPERFVHQPPVPPELPVAAWINKPADTPEVAAH